MATTSLCSVGGCGKPVRARGWCSGHWGKWRKYGDPLHTVRPAKLALSGVRFGRLVAVEDTGRRKQGQSVWVCRCDCGQSAEVQAGNLRSGNTSSCGCLQKEARGASSVRHGEARIGGHSVEYTTWWSMISRCRYPSTHAYPWYGGRGISVCQRWTGESGFANFLADMGRRPGEGWSIDRINPDADYEPGNCRWLPTVENSARAARGHKSKRAAAS